MSTFYSKLKASQKISLSQSMRVTVIEFMNNNKWSTNHFITKEFMFNDLYFFWVRNSICKDYQWCKFINENIFSEKFAFEMKKKLKRIYFKEIKKYNKDKELIKNQA